MRYLTKDELLATASAFYTENAEYLPRPNRIDVILSDSVAPADLNKTAFVLAFTEDGDIVLENDVKRGRIEVPGGHIEDQDALPGKKHVIPAANAAEREGAEEAAVVMKSIQPIGIFRSHTEGAKPDGYPYPYPVSCQQFFAGIVERIDLDLLKKDDSHGPIIIQPQDAEAKLQAKEFVLYKHALATLFPDLAVEHGFAPASPHP
jgi:8-oxo-dGTP pyrophosphatase MutT (NUDIX family)